jgi:hypothetical protein
MKAAGSHQASKCLNRFSSPHVLRANGTSLAADFTKLFDQKRAFFDWLSYRLI